tara:strand:- start:4170 stop:4661 length:492 start_codon:yes stop_codon:yes gene_type:complete
MPAGRKKSWEKHPALYVGCGEWQEFTQYQQNFLYARQAVRTTKEAYRAAGVTVETVYKLWRKNPKFLKAMEEAIAVSKSYDTSLNGPALVQEATVLLAKAMRGQGEVTAAQLNAAGRIITLFKGSKAEKTVVGRSRKDTRAPELGEVVGIPGRNGAEEEETAD